MLYAFHNCFPLVEAVNYFTAPLPPLADTTPPGCPWAPASSILPSSAFLHRCWQCRSFPLAVNGRGYL